MKVRRVQVGCEFTYIAAIDTPTVFQVEPRAAAPITLEGPGWTVDPAVRIRGYTDIYANQCARLVLPAGKVTLRYGTIAVVPDATEDFDDAAPELAPEDLPDDVLIYTLPSRYCLPDMLGDEAWSRFGGMPTGYTRVAAICDYVNEHLTFQYGSSGPQSTAVDVN